LVKALQEHEMRLTANCRFGKNRGMNRREIEPVAMLTCRRFLEKLERLIPPTQQKTYEERAEIPKGKITKWRRGEQHIRLEEAWRLARELGVSLDWLADDAREMPPGDEMSPEMRRVIEIAEELGPQVARARLIQSPGPAEAGPVKRHTPDPASESTRPKSRQRRP
jgi:transcriptional regulator with XRE-family HTH domain